LHSQSAITHCSSWTPWQRQPENSEENPQDSTRFQDWVGWVTTTVVLNEALASFPVARAKSSDASLLPRTLSFPGHPAFFRRT
jgi:hypothetical protein